MTSAERNTRTSQSREASLLPCVLGIDGGGTKTACVVLARSGATLASAQSHASNYHAVGADIAQANVRLAIERAIAAARQNCDGKLAIEGIGLGLAGIGSREDVAVVRGWVAEYIAERVGDCPWQFHDDDRERVYIDHDCAIALTGGILNADDRIAVAGIAAIAGTGSIVFGRNDNGSTARVGGWGYLLGDEGSGYDLARRGLQAALQASDGRGAPTRLLAEFSEHFQARSPRDLAIAVYRQNLPVRDIAALATIVDRVAADGDPVARNIIEVGADELARAIGSCAGQLFAPTDTPEVVTIGGVWQSQAGFRERVRGALRSQFPGATLVWPRSSPAHGAALTVLCAIAQQAPTPQAREAQTL
ncbi:MAG: N-acetylglucosamine kinase [Geitlerinemataceae cyanobacterium]